MNIDKVPASHGLKWLLQGFVLLRRSFFMWLLFVLLLWGMVFVAAKVPFAGLLLALLTPVFLGGLMIGCQALAKGESTTGGVDIEVVPDDQLSGRMRLIIPLKKQNSPGEE